MKATFKAVITIDYEGDEPLENIAQHLSQVIPETADKLADEGLMSGDLDTYVERYRTNIDIVRHEK